MSESGSQSVSQSVDYFQDKELTRIRIFKFFEIMFLLITFNMLRLFIRLSMSGVLLHMVEQCKAAPFGLSWFWGRGILFLKNFLLFEYYFPEPFGKLHLDN